MVCSRVLKVKMDRLLSKDHTVVTVDLKARTRHSFLKALRNLNPDMQQPQKAKQVVTLHRTQLLRRNSQVHLKILSLSRVINNNRRWATIPMVTHTTPALTMLRT